MGMVGWAREVGRQGQQVSRRDESAQGAVGWTGRSVNKPGLTLILRLLPSGLFRSDQTAPHPFGQPILIASAGCCA